MFIGGVYKGARRNATKSFLRGVMALSSGFGGRFDLGGMADRLEVCSSSQRILQAVRLLRSVRVRSLLRSRFKKLSELRPIG
jgi:hypothetical protein